MYVTMSQAHSWRNLYQCTKETENKVQILVKILLPIAETNLEVDIYILINIKYNEIDTK